MEGFQRGTTVLGAVALAAVMFVFSGNPAVAIAALAAFLLAGWIFD